MSELLTTAEIKRRVGLPVTGYRIAHLAAKHGYKPVFQSGNGRLLGYDVDDPAAVVASIRRELELTASAAA